MKVAIAFLACLIVVLAEPPVPSSQYLPSNQYGPPAQTAAILRPNNQYGPPRPGNGYLPPSNGGYDDQSEPANYHFEYHVQDAQSGNDFGHEESRQGDVAQGKYFVLLPDGRRQTVEYVADSQGYRPKISYEQVGNGGGYNNGGYPAANGGNGGYQY